MSQNQQGEGGNKAVFTLITLSKEILKKNSLDSLTASHTVMRMWGCFCSQSVQIFSILVVLEDVDEASLNSATM